MADQSIHSELHARLRYDARCHYFSPLRIWHTENCHLPHSRLVENNGVNLTAIDIFTAGYDHVLLPITPLVRTIQPCDFPAPSESWWNFETAYAGGVEEKREEAEKADLPGTGSGVSVFIDQDSYIKGEITYRTERKDSDVARDPTRGFRLIIGVVAGAIKLGWQRGTPNSAKTDLGLQFRARSLK